MLVKPAHTSSLPDESVKLKMLDKENYGKGDSIDTMPYLVQLGKILGLNDESLQSIKKDPSIQLQLTNLVNSMQKDFLSSSDDAQIVSDSSSIGESFTVDGGLPPNYALGSCYLPRANSTSTEFLVVEFAVVNAAAL